MPIRSKIPYSRTWNPLQIPESGYQTTTVPASQGFSPFDFSKYSHNQFTSLRNSRSRATTQFSEEFPDFTYDEECGFENFDDLFGEMPEMPRLDGVIDQEFLEFLDMHQ